MSEPPDRQRFLSPQEYARQLRNLETSVSSGVPGMGLWSTRTPYAPQRADSPVGWIAQEDH